MFINRKQNTKKQRAYEYYNSFKWSKVTRPTFYYRVRLWKNDNWEELIRTKIKGQYNRKPVTPKGKWAKEMMWYNEHPEPKASKCLFRNRLNCGYRKEEAILIGDEWLKVKREKRIYYPQVQKTYTPKPKVVKPVDERDFKIEITLSKEEARVFRKEYMKMIEQLEWELTYTEEKTEVVGLNKRIAQLQKELMIFNCYNPR